MANEIRIRSNLAAVNDNSVTNEGTSDGDYTHYAIDAHANRAFGGKYDTLTTYANGAIASYTNAVVAENGATDGLDASGWQEGAAGPTKGTLPTNVYAIAIEYVKETGTVNNVTIGIKPSGGVETTLASLSLGESIVIPISGGLTLSEIMIGASAYSDGTNEATVNVLLLGT